MSEMYDNENHFFEGVEKLLEVWFSRKDGMIGNNDLKEIPRSELELLMQMVKCEIISKISSEDMDAYVLSLPYIIISDEIKNLQFLKELESFESSMFISGRRFILKTCGTTTPLTCLPMLLSLVKEYTGYDTVQELYYSRKNFKRPELQISPHRTFQDEIKILDKLFPGGRAYCLGSLNGEDCWYLYTFCSRPRKHGTNRESSVPNFINKLSLHQLQLTMRLGTVRTSSAMPQACPIIGNGMIRYDGDQTLEILMTDLDQDKMKYYFKDYCSSATEATKKSGIDRIIPGVVIDDFLFDPCGYSMNGILRAFPDNESDIGIEENVTVPEYGNYDAHDIQICKLPEYDLIYALYNRFPS